MIKASECDNYKEGICMGGSNLEKCNKCCSKCQKPCEARCGCPKEYGETK